MARDLVPGATLQGYRITTLLGRGGMGSVYRAERDGREVALKVIDAQATDGRLVERFRREARAAAAVSHPNLAAVHHAGEDQGFLFVVLELVEGPTLWRLLGERGAFPWRDVCRYGAEIARALAAIHDAGVVHRDVKPSNVAIDAEGRARLLDFGIATALTQDVEKERLTATGELLGTLEYCAPEQIVAAHAVDARADLYALGASLFELLARRPPFVGRGVDLLRQHVSEAAPDVRGFAPETPPALAALVARLLAKRPADRPASAAGVALALDGIARGDGAAGGPRLAIALALGVAGAALAAGVALAVRPAEPTVPPPPPVRPAAPVTTPSAVSDLNAQAERQRLARLRLLDAAAALGRPSGSGDVVYQAEQLVQEARKLWEGEVPAELLAPVVEAALARAKRKSEGRILSTSKVGEVVRRHHESLGAFALARRLRPDVPVPETVGRFAKGVGLNATQLLRTPEADQEPALDRVAIDALKLALEVKDETVDLAEVRSALAVLVELLVDRGRLSLDEAERLHEHLLARSTRARDRHDAYELRILLLLKNRGVARAVVVCDEARKEFPDDAGFFWHRIEAILAQGDLDTASADAKEGLRRFTEHQDAFWIAGQIASDEAVRQSDPAERRRLLELAIDLLSRSAVERKARWSTSTYLVVRLLAETYDRAGRFEEALAICKEHAKDRKNASEWIYAQLHARVLLRLHRDKEARKVLREVLERDVPQDVRPRFSRVLERLEAGIKDDAERQRTIEELGAK